jgi:uncharacterized protein (TIGR03437 family)
MLADPAFKKERTSMMTFTKTMLVRLALLHLAAFGAMANSGSLAAAPNPPLKRTGAAVDGGLDCTACHSSGGPANSDPRGRLRVRTPAYTPGVPQWIHVHIDHPDGRRWGFQLTARLASDPTKQAGTFRSSADAQVKCDDGSLRGSPQPCDGKLEFAMHTASSTRAGTPGGADWWVQWIPPATDVGDIVIYAAGNAADASSSNVGDRVYTTSTKIRSVFGSSLTATIPFRADLSPANEVPAITNLNASGKATLWLHLLRDATGRIVSGSVDFNVRYNFQGEHTFTGLHIHRGAAGTNGPVTVNTGISASAPVRANGPGEIRRQAQVQPDNEAGLATISEMLGNPEGFYVNLHTTAYPGGAVRGQLQRADMLVLMSQLSPANEVPAVTGLDARGTGSFILVAGRDGEGRITSAEAIFDVNYTGFPSGTNFTGLHIHTGAAGANGPVVIDSGIRSASPVSAAASGAGNLHYEVDVDMTNPAAAAAVNGLFAAPQLFYLNLHTTVNPAGAIRGQTRRTDRMRFEVEPSGANEVPPIIRPGSSAAGSFTLHALRNADGTIAAGLAVYDVNYRFPGAMRFTGMHIHTGAAGVNGGVVINSPLSAATAVETASGSGNLYYFWTTDTDAGIAAMNGLAANPENYYLNLHSSDNPAGEVRAQLAARDAELPRISAVINAVSDPALETGTPGGLVTIFGSGLSKVFTTLDGMPSANLPGALNGTSVTIGGLAMPLFMVAREPSFSPADFIVAQIPFDAPPGNHPVVVTSPNGASNAVTLTVVRNGPGLYFDDDSAIAFRLDGSLVRTSAPARTGEPVVFATNGLGQTVPPLANGEAAASLTSNIVASNVEVLFGDQAMGASGAVAVPGLPGTYFVQVTVPQSAGVGLVPVAIRVNGVASNRAILPVIR